MDNYNNFDFYKIHPLRCANAHISDTCNFQCPFCDLPDKKKNSFVSVKKVKQKLAAARKHGFGRIFLSGQETIIHPRIDEILNYAITELGYKGVALDTNGLAFSDSDTMERLGRIKKNIKQIHIGLSVNFYDPITFSASSGHDQKVFAKWCQGAKSAIEKGHVGYINIIFQRSNRIGKILDFLSELSGLRSHDLNLRLMDLSPFNRDKLADYLKNKHTLRETSDRIRRVIKFHPGQIELEGFPFCVFSQKDLKAKKYFTASFYLRFMDSLPIQFDPIIYNSFYSGPTENWVIDQDKLTKSYERMFYDLDECRKCHYRNYCFGIHRDYVEYYSKSVVNNEVKKLKQVNWR